MVTPNQGRRRVKPKSAKAKGRRLQDTVRARVMDVLGLLPGDIKCAIMGESGSDHYLSPAGKELFPYTTECKNTERLNIWDALKQARANREIGTSPLVLFTRNHEGRVYAALDFEELLLLLRRANNCGGRK